jgi:hypothetical protein
MSFSTLVTQVAPAALSALVGLAGSLEGPLPYAQPALDSVVMGDVGERTGPPEPADGHGTPPFACGPRQLPALQPCRTSEGQPTVERASAPGRKNHGEGDHGSFYRRPLQVSTHDSHNRRENFAYQRDVTFARRTRWHGRPPSVDVRRSGVSCR